MYKKPLFFLSSVSLLLTACGDEETDNSSENSADSSASARTIAENLDVPWAIQPHEDGYFISERPGTIAWIDENGSVTRTEPDLSDEVAAEGEGGLLGFVLDPDFDDANQTAYAYYTYESDNGLANRIVSLERSGDDWRENDVLLDEIPGASIHNGGRLEIGPDGMLYATTGDADVEDSSQDPENLAGSILRMEMNGMIPEDNPMEDSYVYSYGHRNPQGLAWNEEGTMYSSEHGSSAEDEINQIQAGENYGWPEITGDEQDETMQSPLFHSGSDTWAPSGMDAEANGNLFVTGLRGTQLMQFNVETEEMNVIYSGEGRLRDVWAEEERLYIVTNNSDGRGNPSDNDDRLIELTDY